jgi:GR25 family glycosyltransferase involved in LPS biosynthesis
MQPAAMIEDLKLRLREPLATVAQAQTHALANGIPLTVIALPRHGHATTATTVDSFYAHTRTPAVFIYLDIMGPAAVREHLDFVQETTPGFVSVRVDEYISRQMARLLVLDLIRTPFTLFLDNNMLLSDGCVDRLIHTADSLDAMVVSPVITMQGGAMHFSCARIDKVKEDWHERHQTDANAPLGVAIGDCRLSRQQIDFAESHCCLMRTRMFQGTVGDWFPVDMHNAHNLAVACFLYRRAHPDASMVVEPEAVVSILPIAFGYDLPWLFESYNNWSYFRQSYAFHTRLLKSASTTIDNLHWHRKHFLYLLETLLEEDHLERQDLLRPGEIPTHVRGYDLPLPGTLQQELERRLAPFLGTGFPAYADQLHTWLTAIGDAMRHIDYYAARNGNGRNLVPTPLSAGHLLWNAQRSTLIDYPQVGQGMEMNAQAGAVWELCNGTNSEADIEKSLVGSFPEHAQDIVNDVRPLLEQLQQHGRLALHAPVIRRAAPTVETLDAVVINLASDKERMARASSQLEAEGLSWRRFEAVDRNAVSIPFPSQHVSAEGRELYATHGEEPRHGSLNRGSLAAALSWQKVIQGLYRGARGVLVFEDDFVLCGNFRDRLRESLGEIPDDYHLAYLSWNAHDWGNTTTINPFVEKLHARLHGLGAVIINPSAKDALLSLFPLTRQLDHDLPDRLISTGHVNAYKLTWRGERLVANDNLGGTRTQA